MPLWDCYSNLAISAFEPLWQKIKMFSSMSKPLRSLVFPKVEW
jgi:hypothetical protein